jgi:hypothetical protein
MQRDAELTPDERELARARETISGMLATRGIPVHDGDRSADLARLLDAVELFEECVARAGGDSMTNAPDSSQPDNPRFVLPVRSKGEPARDYSVRLRAAASTVTRAD